MSISHIIFFPLKFDLFIWRRLPAFRQQETFNVDNLYRDSYLLFLQDAFAEQFCSIWTMTSFPANEIWCSWYVCGSQSCFFRPTNEQVKMKPNILNLLMVYVFGILHMILGKKKTIERKIYRCRFMPIKRLIDLGRLQWLWSMFYYKKEMLIFLKISEFINICLENIRGPSIMGLVQTQYIHAWHI